MSHPSQEPERRSDAEVFVEVFSDVQRALIAARIMANLVHRSDNDSELARIAGLSIRAADFLLAAAASSSPKAGGGDGPA